MKTEIQPFDSRTGKKGRKKVTFLLCEIFSSPRRTEEVEHLECESIHRNFSTRTVEQGNHKLWVLHSNSILVPVRIISH